MVTGVGHKVSMWLGSAVTEHALSNLIWFSCSSNLASLQLPVPFTALVQRLDSKCSLFSGFNTRGGVAVSGHIWCFCSKHLQGDLPVFNFLFRKVRPWCLSRASRGSVTDPSLLEVVVRGIWRISYPVVDVILFLSSASFADVRDVSSSRIHW